MPDEFDERARAAAAGLRRSVALEAPELTELVRHFKVRRAGRLVAALAVLVMLAVLALAAASVATSGDLRWIVTVVLWALAAVTCLFCAHAGHHAWVVPLPAVALAALWSITGGGSGTAGWWLAAGCGAAVAVGVAVAGAALRMRLRGSWIGLHQLVNATGVTVTALTPVGVVRVNGESWTAESLGGPLPVGVPVDVVRVRGLRLEVSSETETVGRSDDPGTRASGLTVESGSDAVEPLRPAALEKLPEAVGPRLVELESGLFTSDLSVNEFLLVREAGFRPLGLVMGSSIYHVGRQLRRWGRSLELTTLSQAMYSARELAMERMEAEAVELGADGVVGVRLDVNYYDWGRGSAEFIAVGTAVRAEDGKSWRNKRGMPFTSDLSGQDFWTLLQTGHVPLGLVMGNCVYHVARRGPLTVLRSIGRNRELTNFTGALYEARELAMRRMQEESEQLDASGVVAVQLEQKSHQWGSHTIEFLALGTAVARRADPVELPRPMPIISFDR